MKFKLSPFEKKDLVIAWLALAVAFTLGASGILAVFMEGFSILSPEKMLLTFVISLITVGLSFVLHELAHKFAAIKFGYWAEFRKSAQMLVIAVAVAVITGIVFAAPGATLINTAGRQMTKRENGIISISGPLVNIILIIPFAVIMFVGVFLGGVEAVAGGLFFNPFTLAGFLFYLGMIGCQINAMLAFFNMLPVGPLDGKKILAWKPAIFVVVLLITLLLVYFAVDPVVLVNIITPMV
ncbi:MAG: peptidase M50 [Methanocorpusculum sp.]|nr:peptidase M50 [Methanocorpusculum parvum]MBQ4134778.1 peptidase M50 [Methanocorpusculum sp.]HJJ72530.1 peptidase M50 [Methanocorpusculum sp.]HJJ76662.1 peptidase M50 [Methanocorpusculum sp.]HJJ78916.1 peptidase M50 [Methanocorpusculum sp.]